MSLFIDFKEFISANVLYRSGLSNVNLIDDPSYVSYALNTIIQSTSDSDVNFNNNRKAMNNRDKLLDIIVFTEQKLKISNISENILSDKILYENNIYEVVSVEKWNFFGKKYYKNLCVFFPETKEYIESKSTVSPLPLPEEPPNLASPILIKNEQATGVKDGVNRVFTSQYAFLYSHLSVFLNGNLLTQDFQYEEVTDNSIRIIEELTPENTDSLVLEYFRKL